jgi:hypothetical protein
MDRRWALISHFMARIRFRESEGGREADKTVAWVVTPTGVVKYRDLRRC